MSFLKPKPEREFNANRGLITDTYRGSLTQGTEAMSTLNALLTGRGDTAGAQTALQGYYDMAGYAPAMRQLSQNVTGQAAASGLLRSGPTARRLMTLGTELNQQMFNNYLQQLSNLSGLGLQAGNLVANVGQTRTGKRPSTLGSAASAVGGLVRVFSDRRLKTDIRRIGSLSDGLGVYRFRYKGDDRYFEGVMADEVAVYRPWALGPDVFGFATVDYGRL